jgi:hypothetical protein
MNTETCFVHSPRAVLTKKRPILDERCLLQLFLVRKRAKALEKLKREPWEELPPTLPNPPESLRNEEARPPTVKYSEDIRRVEVDEEDRLAFRVGVNFITLVVIGVGVYFLVRYLWG